MYFCSFSLRMNKKIFLILIPALLLTSCGSSVQYLTQDDFTVITTSYLPSELEEISSLQLSDNGFYGINDSGGEPVIYFFNDEQQAEITGRIRLKDAVNFDWETTAENDSAYFVGDTGNNIGNRHNLRIYRVAKDFSDEFEAFREAESDTIGFFYPEQEVIQNQAYQHDFDMEAMVYFNNKLHLFTKEWKSEQTRHYTLDVVYGKQPAWLVERYDVNFLVTGADVFPVSNTRSQLALIGYNREGEVTLMLAEFGNRSKKWLNGNKKYISLGHSSETGQVEGVVFRSENELCWSAEALKTDEGVRNQNVTCIRLN